MQEGSRGCPGPLPFRLALVPLAVLFSPLPVFEPQPLPSVLLRLFILIIQHRNSAVFRLRGRVRRPGCLSGLASERPGPIGSGQRSWWLAWEQVGKVQGLLLGWASALASPGLGLWARLGASASPSPCSFSLSPSPQPWPSVP